MAKNIKSVNLLPETHRTDKNSRFLSSTVDQLIQKPELERINGFIGTKDTPTYNSSNDIYISESTQIRQNYNLEPALVTYSTAGSVVNVVAIDDLTNEINFRGGITDNFDRIYKPKYYAYDPFVDWDKLVNFQEYFWLVTGPQTIEITGRPKNTTSTYTVEVENSQFVFTPSGMSDSILTLYRGNTYNFENLTEQNFYVKFTASPGNTDLYPVNVVSNGTSTGIVKLIVDVNTPSVLYCGGNDKTLLCKIVVKDSREDSTIDIEKDILGKKSYLSGNGIALSNGMKIKFGGTVLPEKYRDNEYIVEGVGEFIRLVDYKDLIPQSVIASNFDDNFDANPFDEYPFDNFKNLPINPEYLTINRASRDLNPWSRYNRWFHKDIITISAEFNNMEPEYPSNLRAQRPIIEFKPNLQLYNFGNIAIPNVDLIDFVTTDPLGQRENTRGLFVDGRRLNEGMTVIFAAAKDDDVRNKVFRATYFQRRKARRLNLEPIQDVIENNCVSINYGTRAGGRCYHYDGSNWKSSQNHTRLNQAPLFDLFDKDGKSYSDKTYYYSNFAGNRVFSYKRGSGTSDSVLGFPLSYRNLNGVGSYLFRNYFMNDSFTLSSGEYDTTSTSFSTAITFLKKNDEKGDQLVNVWRDKEDYQIPVYQLQSYLSGTSTVEINSVKLNNNISFEIEAYNDEKIIPKSDYNILSSGTNYTVNFNNTVTSNVLLKIFTDAPIVGNGYYETPLNLTNNPLNGNITDLTLSEISDHVGTMVNRDTSWSGIFPGTSNLRDLPGIAKYGTRLISNYNPITFAQLFLGSPYYSVESAIKQTAKDYEEFKNNFLTLVATHPDQNSPVSAVDTILKSMVANISKGSAYHNSDMIPFGSHRVRQFTVLSSRRTDYPISLDYNPSKLSNQAVLVYINGVQGWLGRDYIFLDDQNAVRIITPIVANDTIEIREYTDTSGCYCPQTPSKLGLYPAFRPRKYFDDSYIDRPRNVIIGHDGSKMIAYNDYRDDIIIELEKRIFNNIKSKYNPDLLDINSLLPNAFRKTEYSLKEINQILQSDFVTWAGLFGLDYQNNSSFDEANPFTYNYVGTSDTLTSTSLSGFWRGIYKYFYDTDLPHKSPWRMLGFYDRPEWWIAEYGPSPYTSGNDILWQDLENGYIRGGSNPGYNPIYARPGLTNIIPVDESGKLIDPSVLLITNSTPYDRRQNWKFGDHGPVETVWRNSSSYPYAIQRLLLLTKPAEYCSVFFDVSRLIKNAAGQWVNADTNRFLNLKDVALFGENNTLAAGYSVWVIEQGLKRNSQFVYRLRNRIDNFTVNLFHKVGGFVDKNKLRIIIDSVSPSSTDPGAILPQENYLLHLNVSNPVEAVAASGIVIQKQQDKFIVKGYDRYRPYFTIYQPIRNSNTPAITIGGISESFVDWNYNDSSGSTSLSAEDLTTANTATGNNFYQQGQIVRYLNKFYRVKVSHTAEANFNPSFYAAIPQVPIKGGATVQIAKSYSKQETLIPYGTMFDNIQDVYDVIIGYGQWLVEQGFIFDNFNQELNTVLDWRFSAKEFLYWSTQNWAPNSIITLAPFSPQVKFRKQTAVTDNFLNGNYDYTILTADGSSLPSKNLSVNRDDDITIIEPTNTNNGIFFIYVRPVQKEHGMIFDNTTIFNDIVYDPETGYRQKRMKLVGFRTSNWNGDYSSPGFVYDKGVVNRWEQFTLYRYGDVVTWNGKYYSAANSISGSSKFNIGDGWVLLDKAPTPGLIPNFDYKISQFEDFYSIDIDNFDAGQQKMAQHLIGYTPRVYLDNIVPDAISQYKFYQGYIREKGTRNPLTKISKSVTNDQTGSINFDEEWAFRVGQYGSYTTFRELEFRLTEGSFIENPQIINFVDTQPTQKPNDLVYYIDNNKFAIQPSEYSSSNVFFTSSSTFKNPGFKYPTAGYVNLNDITYTAYNENSLLDIANNGSIKDGDVIWLGFKTNGDWDVLRYENSPFKIIGVFVNSPGVTITFTTDYFHDFKVGDTVSVVNFNNQVNGIYKIIDIPQLNQFTVNSSLTYINNEPLLSPGLIYRFVSQRFKKFDDIPVDSKLLALPYGSKFWIDENNEGKWEVYTKTKNYSQNSVISRSQPLNQQLGTSIAKSKNDSTLLVGAPGYQYYLDNGRVFVYDKIGSTLTFKLSYTLNSDRIQYHDSSISPVTEFGYKVDYIPDEFNNSGYGLFIVGAPATENVYYNTVSPGAISYAHPDNTNTSTWGLAGVVKISSVDPLTQKEKAEVVLSNPWPTDRDRFGAEVAHYGNLLLVGAPGTNSTGTGRVFSYSIDTTGYYTTSSAQTVIGVTTSMSVTYTGRKELPAEYTAVDSDGVMFGHSISISDEEYFKYAVGGPGYKSENGLVAIFGMYSPSANQVIQPPTNVSGTKKFGHKVVITPTQLFVSAPLQRNSDLSYGAVYIYDYDIDAGAFNTSTYQIITNPLPGSKLNFGQDLSYIESDNSIVISSTGDFTPKFNLDKGNTTFDQKSTKFYNSIRKTGTAYVYSRKDTRYVLADELKIDNYTAFTDFGYTVHATENEIFVGAPSYSSTQTSKVYEFNKIDTTVQSWDLSTKQDDVISLNEFRQIHIFDTKKDIIVDYLDVVDPLKGKIPGLADQEIKYKAAFDPAVYSIGIAGTVVDINTNWLDEHVGELWWDLSTLKYVWYEQGDLSYRKNNWGRLFPGATIDVYEWIGTPLLPSEWSSQADTAAGLTNNISGQPKFADNSVVSVKQIYDSVTNSFSNYYFYWVKNKVIIPNVKNRRISSYQVASLIADPTGYGYKYASIIAPDAMTLANSNGYAVDTHVHLNITYDKIDNKIPKHTEWILLNEGSENSMPPRMLERKLFNSLIGKDTFGHTVPDPSLNERTKYGIGIRPQQTLFKSRLTALRNLIEFSNNVLIKEQIVGMKDLTRLLSQEVPPDQYSGLWDKTVEDLEGLSVINTTKLVQAEVTCTVADGTIRSVQIVNSGYGYLIAPIITVIANENDINTRTVKIETEIDEFGRLVSTNIVDGGRGFTVPPTLTVRPFSVIVTSDSTFNGKWTLFTWDKEVQQWNRIRTQKYNTPLYWNYIDWTSSDFDQFRDISKTVNELFELNYLNLPKNSYIKINNPGDNLPIILEKVTPSKSNTFSNGYNIVYKQGGTIQFSNGIWDIYNNDLGYDKNNSYDQTLYDQTIETELRNILIALRDDIFVDELKVYWNKFFFTAVKYAMSEQPLLDWAFKTSFINVVNNAGLLDQRPVYKLNNSEYYENFLKEIKPYRSQIRTFTNKHKILEPSQSFTTDFDSPSYFNRTTKQFETISETDALSDVYPWKAWKDNNSFIIDSISVGNGGQNYILPPSVIIETAPGDLGSGAAAQAYISSGQVNKIVVTNPGVGYKKAPLIRLEGGGYADLVPAVAYPIMANNKVRTNTIKIKFDRISTQNQIGDDFVVDSFNCDGTTSIFYLNWCARLDRSKISVTIDGAYVLSSEYIIQNYEEEFNGYTKKYSKLQFVNRIPEIGKVLVVKYAKNLELYSAAERVLQYYSPKSGMPGKKLDQVMSGVVYPKTQLQTLGFDYTSKWDNQYEINNVPVYYSGFETAAYGDDVSYYTLIKTSSTTTVGSNTLTLATVEGIVVGQNVNISNTLTNKFSSSTVLVTAINQTSKTVTLNTSVASTVFPGDSVEFWTQTTNFTALDTIIDSGYPGFTLTNTGSALQYALGINPEDITIDGDGFFTPDTSFATEEFVPGESSDSIGINVYTKSGVGAPLIYTGKIDVPSKRNKTELFVPYPPPTADSIVVTFNTQILQRTEQLFFAATLDSPYYYYDFINNKIIIYKRSVNGVLGYSVVTVGGEGVVDHGSTVVYNQTDGQVDSLAYYDDIKLAYVTVNGEIIGTTSTSFTNKYYDLTYSNESNKRASVHVHNLNTNTTSTIQAWFFDSDAATFNEVRSQTFVYDNVSTATNIEINRPPGVIEPFAPQVILEVSVDNGVTYRRVMPPFTAYYNIVNTAITTYSINNSRNFVDKFITPGTGFTVQNVDVFVNGVQLARGMDYTVDDDIVNGMANPTITLDNELILTEAVKPGDVLAIVAKPDLGWEFDIISGSIYFNANAEIVPGYIGYITDCVLKITTYTNHDQMLMRTERFVGNTYRRFRISRQVLNNNFVWVTLNNQPLVNKYDYIILDDGYTIQISDTIRVTEADEVVIQSFSTQILGYDTLGYRVFKDMFGRQSFKRLSRTNSTTLTQPLNYYDTEIHVADASVLTPPSLYRKQPGVVTISGERIEFYKVDGNVLKQLRRATMGTGASFSLASNSKVIDQGINQTVPYSEEMLVQSYLTTSTTTYTIFNYSMDDWGDGIALSQPSTSTIISSALALNAYGIALDYYNRGQYDALYDLNGDSVIDLQDLIDYQTLASGGSLPYTPSESSNYQQLFEVTQATSPIPAKDQIAVYFGGRLLKKDPYFYHDTTLAYDSPQYNIIGTMDNETMLSTVTTVVLTLGDGYIVTSTNQVWIYTNSTELDAVNGFVYRGLKYAPPEFTINTSTQQIKLNIVDGVEPNIKLSFVKKQFNRLSCWNNIVDANTTLSLLESTTVPAKFLQARPAELPDSYYYGGPDILTDGGNPLTDTNSNPLIGN